MKKRDRLQPKKKRKYRVKREPIYTVYPSQVYHVKEFLGVR